MTGNSSIGMVRVAIVHFAMQCVLAPVWLRGWVDVGCAEVLSPLHELPFIGVSLRRGDHGAGRVGGRAKKGIA